MTNRTTATTHRTLGLVCSVLWAVSWVFAQDTREQERLEQERLEQERQDRQELQAAGVGTDAPALLAYFKQRLATTADDASISALIAKLGDEDFAVRQKATEDIEKLGVTAVRMLMQSRDDPDPEVARRVRLCLERVEKITSPGFVGAAARTLARSGDPQACAVLLDFLKVADDSSAIDAVQSALAELAAEDDPARRLLESALSSKEKSQRLGAAIALIRSGKQQARDKAKQLLKDADLSVRFNTAIALVTEAFDSASVPALIGLLPEVDHDQSEEINSVLLQLAGDNTPNLLDDTNAQARGKNRDTWLAWWEKNGQGLQLAKLVTPDRLRGWTMILEQDKNGQGRITEYERDMKTVRWQLTGLRIPIDARALANGRVLVAEYGANEVNEIDPKAKKTVWSYKTQTSPLYCERLANGNTLIGTQNEVIEVAPNQNVVKKIITRPTFDLTAISRNRAGQFATMSNTGQVTVYDAAGKQKKTFNQQNRFYSQFGALDYYDKTLYVGAMQEVIIYDAESGKQTGRIPFRMATAVNRLPNGNVLVTGMNTRSASEFDPQGKAVWNYTSTQNTPVYRVRRR